MISQTKLPLRLSPPPFVHMRLKLTLCLRSVSTLCCNVLLWLFLVCRSGTGRPIIGLIPVHFALLTSCMNSHYTVHILPTKNLLSIIISSFITVFLLTTLNWRSRVWVCIAVPRRTFLFVRARTLTDNCDVTASDSWLLLVNLYLFRLLSIRWKHHKPRGIETLLETVGQFHPTDHFSVTGWKSNMHLAALFNECWSSWTSKI